VEEGAARGRREALWQVGVAPHATRAGTAGEGAQLALPLEPPEPPALAPLGGWEAMIADYRSTGMTLGEHPLAMMRPGLDRRILRSTDLAAVADGSEVEVAGMVVARQRPETAKGIVFMLLEDERGVVNLIVPPPVYERHRALVRAAPLARARGRLERREGVVNILVSEILELQRRVPKNPHPGVEDPALGGERRARRELAVAELRAVAPAGHSWGRRGG
jgi:error-prone DNA polymerase